MLEDDRLTFVKKHGFEGKPHISEPSRFKTGMLNDWGSASITPPLEMCVGLCEGAKAALFLASWTAKTGRGLVTGAPSWRTCASFTTTGSSRCKN